MKIEACEYEARMKNFVRALFTEKNLDAFVLTSASSIRYLCGYAGRDDVAMFILPFGATLVTGRTHMKYLKDHTVGVSVIEKQNTMGGTIAALLKSAYKVPGNCLVGIEGDMPVSTRREIRQVYRRAYCKVTPLLDEFRQIKSPAELQAILETIRCAESAFTKAVVKPSLYSEKYMARQLDDAMKAYGAEELSFPTVVAYGENCGHPHATPTDRAGFPGLPLMFDWGAVVDGYHSDQSRTLFSSRPVGFWPIVNASIEKVLDMLEMAVKPGMLCRDVYRMAEAEIQARIGDVLKEHDGGYSVNFGHGIGLDEHEVPHISLHSDDTIREGQVICLEPSVYFYKQGCIHIEDMYLVKASGLARLTRLPRHIPG